MKIGPDTWFFFKLRDREVNAVNLLEKIISGEITAIVSVITITELYGKMFQLGEPESAEHFKAICLIIPTIIITDIDIEIAEKAGRYRHGLGIPTVDSIILATSVLKGCECIISQDKHFLKAKEQSIIEVKKPEDLVFHR
ncbi:MAG: type II toxin-antitoxin system VapC family toxin [Methanosarcinales archaeon]